MLQNGYPKGVINYNVNDLLHKHKNRPSQPTLTVPKKDVTLVLPHLGLHSDAITRRLKSCVNKFYGFVNLRVVFQNTRRIKSFFPYKDRFNRSQKSKIVYKASCWDCDAFYIGKTKRRLHDRKTEHFKALTQIGHASAVAEVQLIKRSTRDLGIFRSLLLSATNTFPVFLVGIRRVCSPKKFILFRTTICK